MEIPNYILYCVSIQCHREYKNVRVQKSVLTPSNLLTLEVHHLLNFLLSHVVNSEKFFIQYENY